MNGSKVLLAISLMVGWANVAPPLIAADWTWELGPAEDASVLLPKHPLYPFVPDGHLSIVPASGGNSVIWAGRASYLSTGPSLNDQRLHARPILQSGGPGEFDNGGTWLYSAFQQDGANWLGFYHAEDREFARREADASPDTAWKSIAAATSLDGGKNWTKRGPIISSSVPKPATATWGGSGDFSVVRDQANGRWLCFYAEHWLMAAESRDESGGPGTWKKYCDGQFTESGLGGKSSPIPMLAEIPGGNPSVHFNRHLKRWVIVWHSWEAHGDVTSPGLWISTSPDLTHWEQPQSLLSASSGQKVWYPTIVGPESDASAGEQPTLYYAHFDDAGKSERRFVRRTIRFAGTHE